MSYQAYLLIHFIGIFMVLASLGAMALHIVGGGSKASFGARKLAAAVHGTGLLVVLVAGFGLLARLGILHGGLPGWALAKLLIWLILGALPVLIYRVPKAAVLLFFLIFVLGGLAAAFAIYKPGAPGSGAPPAEEATTTTNETKSAPTAEIIKPATTASPSATPNITDSTPSPN